jgi:hypothetical protein|nr:MAG TPA: hypothetical protein [Caudoviricetes sp.]
MTLEELKNKRVIIVSKPLIFKLVDDLGEEVLQELLEDFEGDPRTDEEILEYIKSNYYNDYDIQDCLDVKFETTIC